MAVIDIKACKKGRHMCSPSHDCVDLGIRGHYECKCKPGLVLDLILLVCTAYSALSYVVDDNNECVQSVPVSLIGSFISKIPFYSLSGAQRSNGTSSKFVPFHQQISPGGNIVHVQLSSLDVCLCAVIMANCLIITRSLLLHMILCLRSV